MWCSAADTLLKLLDCLVSGASFLTGGVFECDIAHCRTVAVKKVKVKSSMASSLPVENLLPQNVGSIINYLQ